MKLTGLQLQGFKSFAKPTQFAFDAGITALVGPNGCGKSNIVDAFKWVLGDRSAKSLRGEEMLDVIFNGSNGTPSSGYAEVAMTFNNSSKVLPIDYDEVTICRRLYRSAESEYLINNQPCRLKDIRELFMGTGVGMESYSIIEQGKMDFILQSTPYERMSLFEEAAGVSKYKTKRKETESNLARVEQDTLRLSDILREVKREIRSIKLQATRAEKYKNVMEQIRAKKASLALYNYHHWQTAKNEVSIKMADFEASRKAINEKTAVSESEIIQLDKEIIVLDNNLKKNQERLVSLRGAVATAHNKIETARHRISELGTEEEQTNQNLSANNQKLVVCKNKLTEITQLLESVSRELETATQELADKTNLFAEITKELGGLTLTLDTRRNEVMASSQKQAQYQNELSAIQSELKSLSLRRDKLAARRQEIAGEIGQINRNQTNLAVQIDEINRTVETLKAEINQKELVIKSLKDDLAQLQDNVALQREELHRVASRREVLADLDAHHEGLSGGVRAVLEKIKAEPGALGTVYGLVCDIIEVDQPNLSTVESVLKDLATAIVVRSASDALRIIQFVKENKKGYVTVVALEAINNRILPDDGLAYASKLLKPVIVRLLDRRELQPTIGGSNSLPLKLPPNELPITADDFHSLSNALLGRYLLVENLSGAAEAVSASHKAVLTLNGEVFTPEGIISGGSAEVSEAGISPLSRKTELRRLQDEIPALQERLQLATEQLSVKTKEIEELERACQQLRNNVYEKKIILVDKTKESEELSRRVTILSKESEINELEAQDVQNQINSLAERATATAEVIKELDAVIAKANVEIEQLNASIEEYTGRKAALERQITELKVKQAQTVEKKEYCLATIGQLNNDIASLEELLKTVAADLQEIKNKVAGLEETIRTEEASARQLEEEEKSIYAISKELETKATAIKDGFFQKRSAIDEAQRQLRDINNNYNELALQEREYSLKIENLCEKAGEEAGLNPVEAYATADINAILALVPDEVNRQIEEMKRNIGSMTDVNLSAIDQLKSLEERLKFLTAQEQDLAKSKQSLQELIRKINHECREMLQATIDRVNENFSQIFRKLFGGGKAELVIVEPRTVVDKQAQIPFPADKSAEPSANSEAPQTPEAVAQEQNLAHGVTQGATRNDILESGIDIIAKPPGKEPSSISLLSGGEKSLTAIALVMAIFKLKASPFCILDEADSALDEHNLDRFAALIKEFSTSSQFIVITHNKKTMMHANILYGLTMQTPGVSKKVSVKMDDKGVAQPVQPAANN